VLHPPGLETSKLENTLGRKETTPKRLRREQAKHSPTWLPKLHAFNSSCTEDRRNRMLKRRKKSNPEAANGASSSGRLDITRHSSATR
jgi:hypothetical protein